jgi:hypothetical protein
VHGIAICAQPPALLQPPTGVMLPPVQLALPQGVLEVANWHVVAKPLHVPWQGAVPVHALRAGMPPVRGSPTIRVQTPSEPVSLQEPHCAVQSLLQQYPSAQ